MKAIITAVILLVFSSLSYAQNEWVASVHIGSEHLDSEEFNETNTGFGLTRNFDAVSVNVGTYVNSVVRVSYYAGVGLTAPAFSWMDMGVEFGAVTGYVEENNVPKDAPVFYGRGYTRIDIGNDQRQVEIGYIPFMHVLTLSLRFGL